MSSTCCFDQTNCWGKNQNGLKKTTGHTQPITNTKPYQTIQHPPFFQRSSQPTFLQSFRELFIHMGCYPQWRGSHSWSGQWLTKIPFFAGGFTTNRYFPRTNPQWHIFSNIFSDGAADFCVNVAFMPGKPFFLWVGEILCCYQNIL